MGMNVSERDRERLRTSPAYGRAVWGLRLLALGPVLLAATVLLVALGVRGGGLGFSLAIAFGSVGVGVGLVWSAVFPLMRDQRKAFAGNRYERAGTFQPCPWDAHPGCHPSP
jgi:hypothetical protein